MCLFFSQPKTSRVFTVKHNTEESTQRLMGKVKPPPCEFLDLSERRQDDAFSSSSSGACVDGNSELVSLCIWRVFLVGVHFGGVPMRC